MPTNPNPIKSRKKDAKAYEKAVRLSFYDPFIRDVQVRLAQAVSTTAVYRATEEAVQQALERGIPEDLIRAEMNRVERYHRERLKQTFRAALGIDVRPFLTNPAIQSLITQKVGENVDLIKTIPPRFHDGLKKRVEQELIDAPFDQQKLMRMFRDEFRSSGFNLRRLTRDQASKLTGDLTRVRQGQLGITKYKWQSSVDERVRPECNQDNGHVYSWDKGSPIDGQHPSARVMCRCSAIPHLTPSNRERLGAG